MMIELSGSSLCTFHFKNNGKIRFSLFVFFISSIFSVFLCALQCIVLSVLDICAAISNLFIIQLTAYQSELGTRIIVANKKFTQKMNKYSICTSTENRYHVFHIKKRESRFERRKIHADIAKSICMLSLCHLICMNHLKYESKKLKMKQKTAKISCLNPSRNIINQVK